ncbi:MAG: class I adenylate-forming enzyme family protein, partial [Janthinobacterium lividum]
MATSPAEHVARNARKFPERIALIDERGQLTYAALEAQTCHFASYLAARGVQRGDKVALLAKSSINWVVAFLAVLKLRATVVPLNYRLTPDDILGNVEDAECKLMITTSDYLASHVAGRIALPWALIDDSQTPESLPTVLRDAAASNTPLATFETATDDDLQIIMFTGGTTGRSKGVMLLNRHVFWNTVHEALDTGMTEFDNTILATPLHHAAALNCWLLPHLYLGATSTIMLEYSPQGLLDMIAAHGVTNGFTPPSMARDLYLVAADCPEKMASFRRWYVGGGVLSAKDREKMYALAPGVKIYYQYGLTEAGVIVTVLKDEDYALAPDSIGRPFVNFEVKIAREDLSWADTGEAGEILVRGPSVMAGYYKRPDATEQAFHDGWLRTGDM